MSKRYTGGVVSSSLPTVNAAGASGVFTLQQATNSISTNNWPPFKVEKSLRFRGSASGALTRTPATTGNQRTFTWSGWVKRGSLGTNTMFDAFYGNNTRYDLLYFNSSDNIRIYGGVYSTGSSTTESVDLVTAAVFRDTSAWYHIVLAVDTTQATASNRVKLYVNGSQVTSFSTSTYPAQNDQTYYNVNTTGMSVGTDTNQAFTFDGYMSEVNFVDGLQLTASSFGGTDKDGNWSPIAYTGTYGTNGFYLNFKDATSTSTVGYDYSGNGNNWSSSGISVTAGVTYDSMIDVPSDQASANVRGNYATLNPLDPKNGTQSNANLTHAMGSNDFASARSTIGMKGGKWYWETKCETTLQSNFYMGIGITADGDYSGYNYIGSTSGGYSYDGRATKLNNNSSSSYGASYTLNDIIGVALDLDNGTIEYYKNGTSQGVAFTGIDITRTYYAAHWIYTTQISYNFGQQPFTYTLPTGFKALNTFNLPEPTIKQPNKYFDATLYTGTGAIKTVTNSGLMQPDLVWAKVRSTTGTHVLTDSVRGANKQIFTNLTAVEASATNKISGFTTTGFTLAADDGSNTGDVNYNGSTYVAWQWNAGGSTVTNTEGILTAEVRANPTAGFSIVTYSGSNEVGSFGHGLGVAPGLIIIKQRDGTGAWTVGVNSPSVGWTWNTDYLLLNTTAGKATDGGGTLFWSAPTSTVVNIGGGSYTSTSGKNLVAYCWAPIAGYSAFGSYTGNGSTNGPFVYTGFKPAYILLKKTSASGQDWVLMDNKRLGYNATDVAINPNANYAENSGYATDFLSNGFKLRTTTTYANGSGATYVYAAFAEMPFKYAKAR